MTRNEFEEYLVLQDKFMDKCNTIASIFAEVVEDFMHVTKWGINLPFETCTGCKEPGFVYSAYPFYKLLRIPFQYIYMTEDELRDVVKNHPEKIEEMLDTDGDWIDDLDEPDDLSDLERELDEGLREMGEDV